MSDIKIYGKLRNDLTDGILAGTDQLIDDTQKKFQSEINKETTQHTSNKSNPHGVTKSQVGLGNVTNDTQVKRSEMGVANGVATLDSNGIILDSQLPSYVDDVIECYATFEKSETSIISNIKLFSDKEKKKPINPETGKIYVELESNHQFRWSGTVYVTIDTPTVIGEVAGTAYDGKKGKDTTDKINSHSTNNSNPHGVTKSQVGLGNVDNTSDLNKPVSGPQQEALNKKVDKVDGKQLSTNDYTTSEKTKLSGIAAGAQVNSITGVKGSSESSYRTGNVDITKANIGLGNVDNTSDLSKPVSTAQQEALNKISNKISNVDNTKDIDKPVSGPQQTALNNRVEPLEKTSNLVININDLDNISKFTDTENPEVFSIFNTHYYTVVYTYQSLPEPISVGKLMVFSDNMRHVFTQVLYTHYFIENGAIIGSHNHNVMFIYTRNYSITDKTWSKWADYCTGSISTETDNLSIRLDNINRVLYNQHSSVSIWSNISGNIIEKGIAKSVTLSWNYIFNGASSTPTSLKLTSGDTVLVSDKNTKTFTESISDTKTYKAVSNNGSIEKSSSVTISAYYPKYFGGSSKTTLTSSDITGFNKQAIKSNASGNYSFNIGANEYAWFCIPSDMTIKKVTSGGFEVPLESSVSVSVSGKGSYNCYRSSKKFKAGKFDCTITI